MEAIEPAPQIGQQDVEPPNEHFTIGPIPQVPADRLERLV
jgi:hypothetical protein